MILLRNLRSNVDNIQKIKILFQFSFSYLNFPSSNRWRIISVILAVLAVLSKETGIMAMVINISVAVLNYVMENVSLTSSCKSSTKDLEKVGQNPITSKIRRRKQTVALKRIFTDIIMVSKFTFFLNVIPYWINV